MMSDENWKQRAQSSMVNAFGDPLACMVRGEGTHLYDSTGKRYLDFLGGIAVNSLGHAHPVFVDAVASQATVLGHISNFFVSPPQVELAERLLRLSGAENGGKVFFTNSGTEAVEAGLKLARLHANKYGKTKIIALEGAFHGRSMGALSLTSKAKYRDPFAPMLPGVIHIPATLDALEDTFDDDVAALFVEPIQGEAGVQQLPEGFLERARQLTDSHSALLIFDEVQTGAGRTGSWFAWQLEGVKPDALTAAKGLAGGFPIGALVVFSSCADLFYPGSHGTTFGGNPLATHTANEVLSYIESEGILANVKAQGEALRNGIMALESSSVKEVRGEGLLLGVELNEPVAPVVAKRAFDKGLIINAPSDRVIRLAPPLIISDDDVQEFLELFTLALEEPS
ncbi:acetylornithine transaminase [Actinomycetaceae bacterium WB03_NA08]|uniref:Acetylornithine transaminase n=2 Tax=Scrofimicrobium canadense TaxID=2652290 RepID=A0A6N7VQ50_9ACTO|nr:acetylornithine transaminase [Scrofimicrobium canadense]